MSILSKINGLETLRNYGGGNTAIKIAVLDGYPDLQHPCFNTEGGHLSPYTPQVHPSASDQLAQRHGTAVCSLIFGKPGSNAEGIAPGCTGVIVPIYMHDSNGNFLSASQVSLAKAIETAIEQQVHIINLSGGQLSRTGHPDSFLQQAIERCFEKGILIVAASGNEGCNCLHVPAAHQHVLAVGSIDENGEPTAETNYGHLYKINGILAPGKNLTAALPGGGTFQTNGATSYAAPVVTGVAALLMSLQLERGFAPDAFAIRRLIERTAIQCVPGNNNDCSRYLRGKLNLPGILSLIEKDPSILGPGTYNIPPVKLTTMDQNILNIKPTAPIGVAHAMAVEPSCNKDNCTCSTVQQEEPEASRKRMHDDEETIMPNSEHAKVEGYSGNGRSAVVPQSTAQQNEPKNALQNEQSSLTNSLLKTKAMDTPKTTFQKASAVPGISTSSLSVNAAGEIDPSDCGCGCGGAGKPAAPAIVYALGTIGYDFGSESHRDSFIQSMGAGKNPHNPADLLVYLRDNPWDASELLWTLNIDATPIYAIFPSGPYANVAFERLVASLEEQQNGNIQRISVPGIAEGTTALLNGSTVTNLYPNLRGMYSWTTSALVAATAAGEKGASRVLGDNVTNFLNRIYYKMRNLGVTAEERALNYSATNAYQVSAVFSSAMNENLELDDIVATKSPICRPGSDCYDVVLTFFNPRERLTQARREYRFTVDVSDVVPVTVGEVRSWSVY